MNAHTLLVIQPFGFSPYAARGVEQDLEPITSNLRRTVNGSLVNTGLSVFNKYRSDISCTDQRALAIDGIWPGQIVTVDCVAELSYKVDGGTQQRPAVPGSIRLEGDYVFYRPRLTMMVVSFSLSFDEYGAEVGWNLRLEEV